MKKSKLRHNEYYDVQNIFDDLYSRSRNGNNFYNLIELIGNEQNIRLAFRNIKNNDGSKTAGTDGMTIEHIRSLSVSEVVNTIRAMLSDYKPNTVRRVFIDKDNGDKRPLGIPTIWDRLFQQCILQVLEPICEAKFHPHSYGFRPNRSQHHALSRFSSLINLSGLHQCVDVDIKGFFDNVNHSKLLKQMWTLGLRDKALLSIISKLLKAEIEGAGIPAKGTPQGGILSPLLSNIVLNELDWWVSDQWETFKTRRKYSNLKHYRALQDGSKMKECFIVRYADDFKLLCRTRSQANRMFFAVNDFLKTRLHLDISHEKSKVINLKRMDSNFLGIAHRVIRKEKARKGHVVISHMTDKSIKKETKKIKAAVKKIQQNPCAKTVWDFNLVVMGIQNYYSAATRITKDLSEINFIINRVLYNRLNNKRTEASLGDMTKTMQKRYKGYNPKMFKIQDMVFVPIHAQKYKKLTNFSQTTSSYTREGREKIHKSLVEINPLVLQKVMRSYNPHESMEFNDNRISRFIAQQGKCSVTGVELDVDEIHCHHIQPRSKGGLDKYQNLTIVHKEIHRAIHMKDENKINKVLNAFKLEGKQLQKFVELRVKVHKYDLDNEVA